jgi:hypothetical protein
MWVFFTGFGGAGKDTAADYLRDEKKMDKMAFADGVRDHARRLNVYFPELGKRYNQIVEELGYETAKKHQCVRDHLVDIGEGCRTTFWESIWIDKLSKRASERPPCSAGQHSGHDFPLVVPDCRYANEAEFGRKAKRAAKGGFCVVILISRPGCSAKHETEAKSIAEICPDAEILNDGTVADLYRKIDGVLQEAIVTAGCTSNLESNREERRASKMRAYSFVVDVDLVDAWPIRFCPERKKVYVAGAFDNKNVIRLIMQMLVKTCHCTITHDWTAPRAPIEETPGGSPLQQLQRIEWGKDGANDLKGVRDADFLVVIYDDLTYSYRGTCTELGAALGLGKPVIVLHLRDLTEGQDQGATYLRNPFLWAKDERIEHVYRSDQLANAVDAL